VAQVHYASRLPSDVAGQDYLRESLLRFQGGQTMKCDGNHGIEMQNYFHYETISPQVAVALRMETDQALLFIYA